MVMGYYKDGDENQHLRNTPPVLVSSFGESRRRVFTRRRHVLSSYSIGGAGRFDRYKT
jgi:hypothetical protein